MRTAVPLVSPFFFRRFRSELARHEPAQRRTLGVVKHVVTILHFKRESNGIRA